VVRVKIMGHGKRWVVVWFDGESIRSSGMLRHEAACRLAARVLARARSEVRG
jgi:hypothetical protein